MSQRFEAALQFVLKWEGSKFTNDPDDRGGATRFGVTQRVYDGFRQRRGQPLQSVKFIAMDEVRAIYTRGYWAPVHGDRMPAPLDLVLFDTGVLMGVGRAVRFLQEALGVAADGAVGPQTLAALQAARPDAVARKVMELREARLRRIVENNPSQGKFLRGWLNRLNDLRRTVGAPAPEAVFAEVGADDEVGYDGADAGPDQDVGPDEGAAGRAEDDLPGDEEEGPAAIAGGSPLQLLVAAEPAAVLAGARALLDATRGAVFALDLRGSSEEVLRALDPAAGPGAAPFDIPVQAVETVTPLGIHGADAGRLLAAVTFRAGFESLAGTFRRLGGGAADGFAPAAALADEEALFAIPVADGGDDDDPAAPGPAELGDTVDLATGRTLANVGTGAGTAELEAQADAAPAAEAATIPTLDIDMAKVKAFYNACIGSTPRVTYGLGAKVPFFNAVPGKDFKKVDCSGFVREAIRRATTPRAPFPDGSVVQHEWVLGRGFRKSTIEAGFNKDGAVRIAFLSPKDSPKGIGHVVLIHNGVTYESHGGTGPNSRPWTGDGWQKKAKVYRLKDPVA
jgi:lysozyme family protein